MPGALAPRVDGACITPMHRGKRAAQAVRIGWHQDQMHVIGHQAPRPHLHIGHAAMLGEQVTVERLVGVAKERAPAAVAALGNVMR